MLRLQGCRSLRGRHANFPPFCAAEKQAPGHMRTCGKAPLMVPEIRPIQIQRALPASRTELKDLSVQEAPRTSLPV